jgi:hypothetical protein
MDILGSLSEDDPSLIQIIRNWFLEPPPSKSSEDLLRISNTLITLYTAIFHWLKKFLHSLSTERAVFQIRYVEINSLRLFFP